MTEPAALLTSVEAAELLGFSRQHVNYLARTGQLKTAQRAGGPRGAFLFRLVDLQRYAKANLPPRPIHALKASA